MSATTRITSAVFALIRAGELGQVTMRQEPPNVAEKVWNSYTWRLREIAALRDDPARATRCRQLTGELVLAEAHELAQGIRHVSIVHGDPATLREADQLDTFMAQVDALVATATWSRRRGDYVHLILAVGGDDADERIGHVVAVAELSNPGHWHITEGARPDLTA
jgi:hypothetical protein